MSGSSTLPSTALPRPNHELPSLHALTSTPTRLAIKEKETPSCIVRRQSKVATVEAHRQHDAGNVRLACSIQIHVLNTNLFAAINHMVNDIMSTLSREFPGRVRATTELAITTLPDDEPDATLPENNHPRRWTIYQRYVTTPNVNTHDQIKKLHAVFDQVCAIPIRVFAPHVVTRTDRWSTLDHERLASSTNFTAVNEPFKIAEFALDNQRAGAQ